MVGVKRRCSPLPTRKLGEDTRTDGAQEVAKVPQEVDEAEVAPKSGKPSTQGAKATGERYLPEKAIKSMSSKEYAATTRKNAQIPRKASNIQSNPSGLPRRLRGIESNAYVLQEGRQGQQEVHVVQQAKANA